jgi:MoaA/NifB/PqqE/SkfB family radical SAM enzyme
VTKPPRAEGNCYAYGYEICLNPDGTVVPSYAFPQPIGRVANLSKCFTHPDYPKLVGRIVGTIEECKGCPIEGRAAEVAQATHGPSMATPTGWQETDPSCAALSPNFCSKNRRKSLSTRGKKAV